MEINICSGVKKDCWNFYDSYGEICVHCGCCSKDPLERAKARLEVSKRRLEEKKSHTDFSEDPKWREIEKKNVTSDIRHFGRQVRYYQARVSKLTI